MQPTRVLEERIIITCWQWILPSQTENIKSKYAAKPQTAKIMCKCFILSYNYNRQNIYTNQCVFSDKKIYSFMSVTHILPGRSEHRSWRKVGKWKVDMLRGAPCHPFCAPNSTADCTRLLCGAVWYGFQVDVIRSRCRYFRSLTQNIWNSFRCFNESPNLFARPFWEKTSRTLLYFFKLQIIITSDEMIHCTRYP